MEPNHIRAVLHVLFHRLEIVDAADHFFPRGSNGCRKDTGRPVLKVSHCGRNHVIRGFIKEIGAAGAVGMQLKKSGREKKTFAVDYQKALRRLRGRAAAHFGDLPVRDYKVAGHDLIPANKPDVPDHLFHCFSSFSKNIFI